MSPGSPRFPSFRRLRCLAAVGAVLLVVSASIRATAGERLPAADETLTKLRLVNERFMARWPDPAAPVVTDRSRPSSFWVRAVYYEGLMALHAIDPDIRYTDYAVAWGAGNAWTPAGGTADRNADNQCCGQTWIDLYRLDPQPERISAIRSCLDSMVNSPASDDWWWIDALQMAMPVFARLGVLTGDVRYHDKMYALYNHTARIEGGTGLYNTTEHLWWRDKDFDPPYREPNGANCYWARGNGWVFAALARVLEEIPADAPHRAEYLRTFQEMAGAIRDCQRADGFWNASMHDPGNFGGREFSGTAFFAFGLAWGVRRGHLSDAETMPCLTRAWHALVDDAVHADGFLGYVQSTGKQPSDGQPVTFASVPNYDDYAVGAFLLAGAEVHRLASITAIGAAGVRKSAHYVQTGPATVTLHAATPLTWEAFLEGTALGDATVPAPRTVTLPGSAVVRALVFDAITRRFVDTASFADAAALATAYPNGGHTLTVGTQLLSGLVLGAGPGAAVDAFPDAPSVTASGGAWSGGIYALPVSATLTLTTNAFGAAFAPGLARIELAIEGTRHQSETFMPSAGGSVSLTVPAFALTAGRTHTVRVDFDRYTTRDDTAALGATGPGVHAGAVFRASTHFTLRVGDEPAAWARKFVNISSRAFAATGETTAIAGFVISGSEPKIVLVRAVGPGLQPYGVGGYMTNPTLRVFNAGSTRAWQNNDWQSSSQYQAIDAVSGSVVLQGTHTNVRAAATAATATGAFALAAGSRDAALVLCLPPGSYTAHATSNTSGATGVVLIEAYEFDVTQRQPRLVNVSTRAQVNTDDGILIAGFVVQGGPKRVLLRAVGPTLAPFGLSPASLLADPQLRLLDSAQDIVAQNDDWGTVADPSAQRELRLALGAFDLPAGSRDAELATTLESGAYTLQVFGANGGTGIALVEVYEDTTGL